MRTKSCGKRIDTLEAAKDKLEERNRILCGQACVAEQWDEWFQQQQQMGYLSGYYHSPRSTPHGTPRGRVGSTRRGRSHSTRAGSDAPLLESAVPVFVDSNRRAFSPQARSRSCHASTPLQMDPSKQNPVVTRSGRMSLHHRSRLMETPLAQSVTWPLDFQRFGRSKQRTLEQKRRRAKWRAVPQRIRVAIRRPHRQFGHCPKKVLLLFSDRASIKCCSSHL